MLTEVTIIVNRSAPRRLRPKAVRETIAPDRLLDFNVKEGWEPLCAFLDVPVPEHDPFPHVNDTAAVETDIQARFGQAS